MNMLKLLSAGMALWLLVICAGSANAQAASGTMTLEQAPGNEVVVRFSGYSSPCDVPMVSPDVEFDEQRFVVSQYPTTGVACTNPVEWTRTVSLGVLIDGEYSVLCQYIHGFATPGWPCGISRFLIANGLLVQYEYAPVPAIASNSIMMLGLILMAFALLRLRRSAPGRLDGRQADGL